MPEGRRLPGLSWRRAFRAARREVTVLLTRSRPGDVQARLPVQPGLIQALVAVSAPSSGSGLRSCSSSWSSRRDTLRLGDVIPLGDLWDVVARGDEALPT